MGYSVNTIVIFRVYTICCTVRSYTYGRYYNYEIKILAKLHHCHLKRSQKAVKLQGHKALKITRPQGFDSGQSYEG